MCKLIEKLRENDICFTILDNRVRLQKDSYVLSQEVDFELIEANMVMTVEQFLINMVEKFVKEIENNG